MTLERGRRASSVDRAIDGWRREAIESRERIHALTDQINQARSFVVEALTELAGTGQETQLARTRLLDVIKVLAYKPTRRRRDDE